MACFLCGLRRADFFLGCRGGAGLLVREALPLVFPVAGPEAAVWGRGLAGPLVFRSATSTKMSILRSESIVCSRWCVARGDSADNRQEIVAISCSARSGVRGFSALAGNGWSGPLAGHAVARLMDSEWRGCTSGTRESEYSRSTPVWGICDGRSAGLPAPGSGYAGPFPGRSGVGMGETRCCGSLDKGGGSRDGFSEPGACGCSGRVTGRAGAGGAGNGCPGALTEGVGLGEGFSAACFIGPSGPFPGPEDAVAAADGCCGSLAEIGGFGKAFSETIDGGRSGATA